MRGALYFRSLISRRPTRRHSKWLYFGSVGLRGGNRAWESEPSDAIDLERHFIGAGNSCRTLH